MKDDDGTYNNDSVDWVKATVSVLSAAIDPPLQVKQLRIAVLSSLEMDERDKMAKKKFKKTIQAMEADGSIQLNADGTINTLWKKNVDAVNEDGDIAMKKRKKSKEEKSTKKKRKIKEGQENGGSKEAGKIQTQETASTGMESFQCDTRDSFEQTQLSSSDNNKSCHGNPQGVTRLFLGNLPFVVDESSLSAFLPGTVTHIKWITDKETGKFYGSAFVEMDNSSSAAEAVAMTGSKLIGRPVKINFAPARDGDVWPPPKKVFSGGSSTGGGGQAGGTGIKVMSVKPENCTKIFVGNLSYDIDDEGITKFFGNVDAEVKAIRWLHHRDSGDFKGVGFVEFWNTEACSKAATLNGKNLLGRPIRIDWTD
jgi:nucleolin